MQEPYSKVEAKTLSKHGKIVKKELYLPQGIHVLDRKPDPTNELFIKEKQKNPYEKRVIV